MLYGQITLGTVCRSAEGSSARIIETSHVPGSRLRWHEHEDLSLDLVLDGDFREHAGREELARSTGSIVIKASGVGHRNRYGGRGTRTLIVHLPPTSALLQDFGRLFTGVRHWEDGARFEPTLMEPFTVPSRAGRALAVDDAVISVLETLAPLAAAVFDSVQMHRMRARVLDDVAGTQLTAIASEFGLSPSAFTHAFRRRFGCTPGAMQRRYRLEKACTLLRASAVPIAMVAAASGFADQAHLTRECHAVLGVTPRQYRLLS